MKPEFKTIVITLVLLSIMAYTAFYFSQKNAEAQGLEILAISDTLKLDVLQTSSRIQAYKAEFGDTRASKAEIDAKGITLPSYQEKKDLINQLNNQQVKTFNGSKGFMIGSLEALDVKLNAIK